MTVPLISIEAPRGPASAPLLVLGPSLGTSGILWDSVRPLLGSRWRTATWDLPGHGAGPAAASGFTVGELADGLAEAIERIGGGPVLYAGVSLGGATGLELALRRPELLGRMAILCSGARIGDPEAWAARAAQAREQSTSSLIIGSAQRWFAPGSIAEHPELTGRLLHALQETDDESYALCCEALARYDVRDRLGRIATPTLALWGALDEVTPEASAVEIAAGVRHGTAVGIADASHLAPVDAPDAVAAALIRFFEGDSR